MSGICCSGMNTMTSKPHREHEEATECLLSSPLTLLEHTGHTAPTAPELPGSPAPAANSSSHRLLFQWWLKSLHQLPARLFVMPALAVSQMFLKASRKI